MWGFFSWRASNNGDNTAYNFQTISGYYLNVESDGSVDANSLTQTDSGNFSLKSN